MDRYIFKNNFSGLHADFPISRLVLQFLGRLLYLYFFSGFQAGFSISRSSSLTMFLLMFQIQSSSRSSSRSSSLPLFLFRFPSWFYHFQVVFFTYISFQVSELVFPFLGRLLYLYFFSGFKAGFTIYRSSSLTMFLLMFQIWSSSRSSSLPIILIMFPSWF